MSMINTAMFGAVTAHTRFEQAASQTASDASHGKDILSDLVEQMEARQALTANISVVKAADAMTGKVLDIKA